LAIFLISSEDDALPDLKIVLTSFE